MFWSKASIYSLPDRMHEYTVSYHIPVSNGQFLRCHIASCITGMLLNHVVKRMKLTTDRESFF